MFQCQWPVDWFGVPKSLIFRPNPGQGVQIVELTSRLTHYSALGSSEFLWIQSFVIRICRLV